MSEIAETLVAAVVVGGIFGFIIGWLAGFRSCDRKWRSR